PASCAKFPVGNPRTISLDGPSPAAATILPCKGSESFPPPNPSLENRWNKTPPPRIRQREGAPAFPGIHRQPPGGRAGGLSPADPPVCLAFGPPVPPERKESGLPFQRNCAGAARHTPPPSRS